MILLPKGLFGFQEACASWLTETVAREDSRQTLVVKAPTGAGKTIILIDFIDRYLSRENANTVFVWLCPGKGDLEEQSRQKMQKLLPGRPARTLADALQLGFAPGSTAFINWELVTKRGNRAIGEGERKNLYDRVAEAKRRGTEFVIIIDEEHSNDTKKAAGLLEAIGPRHIVRVSATAKTHRLCEFYEIDEREVIAAGLITKALYINEDVDYNGHFESEHGYLIALADKKRQEIARAYAVQPGATGEIRPLCLIQFPNASDRLIAAVEEKLAAMGYTYENGLVAKWMSDSGDKRNLEGITAPNARPVFLLMKQAIATGWDCPRAKILVKLRERMSEDFEIQTIGRLRRMPEARHYGVDVLDFCYLYTFDEKYKQSIKANLSQAFEVKRLPLKDKCRGFVLEKQLRNRDAGTLGERESFFAIADYFRDTYGLGTIKADNRLRLEASGYRFDRELVGLLREGKFITTASILEENVGEYRVTRRPVDTHTHGMDMLHAIDRIKTAVGMPTQKTRTVLERLFRESVASPRKLLALDTPGFYAFVINNEPKLREDFRGATAQMARQIAMPSAKTAAFRLPEQELFRYDPEEPGARVLRTAAYEGYSTAMLVEGVRSKCERLFEAYCETRPDVDWVYKNGDTGLAYFSVVYLDGLEKPRLFYPDYIVKKADGTVWIVETKGGEAQGESQNIDRQTANKFAAFGRYAAEKGLRWGFVRDKNERLRMNNTVYTESLQTEHWKPIDEIF